MLRTLSYILAFVCAGALCSCIDDDARILEPDYEICFDALYEVVDYFVVNVSSPNTPNLRELQDKKPLTDLLQTLQNRNLSKPKSKPILLKIAPDLTDDQLLDIIEIIKITAKDGTIIPTVAANAPGSPAVL